ncbi:hypothetical protein QTA58_22710 [Neorhizobium sp. CSC1952]|uniref:hypothetical protein n=1 Tax=Neorhizobium sp. CSC1952 TaxID=2978974 RepID=UPI0025A67DD2|nr:hypothetical protein [Rhizobium sp. CSC1952]WJR66967.1 hypothetical protein QTA58_22710 [Rhizobium sp. CSC1952]
MKVWAIVGDANTRKSSAIRGLTGAWNRQADWRLALSNNAEIRVFVEISAPQERRPKALPPPDFVAMVQREIQGADTTHLIVALRHDATTTCPHDALAYLDHFVNVAKWRIEGICLTGNRRPVTPFIRFDPNAFTVNVDYDPYDASNVVARQIRSRWGYA